MYSLPYPNKIQQGLSCFLNSPCQTELSDQQDLIPGLYEESEADQGPAGAILGLEQSL